MAFPTVSSNTGILCIVYTTEAGGDFPVHGAYKAGEGEWLPCQWTKEGHHISRHRPTDLDISGEFHKIKKQPAAQQEIQG